MDDRIIFGRQRGQTMLTLVTLVGGIILVAGTVFVVLSLSLASTAYQFRASQTAEMVANGGIEDVELQLVRNGSFASTGYTVPIGGWSATVVVTQATPSTGYITATSIASVSGSARQLTAIFSLNASTTQVNLVSLRTTQ